MNKYIVTVLLFTAMSCEEINLVNPLPDETSNVNQIETIKRKTYIIAKGNHYCNSNSSLTKRVLDSLKFRFRFDSSAIYQTQLPENQGDINKLFGLSDCENFHHTNSARFGWRWYHDQLEIWAYCYNNGERQYSLLDAVELNQYHQANLYFKNKEYLFQLNDTTISIPRHCDSSAVGYQLYPYFGGDETAPHDITIEIEELSDEVK